MVLSAKTPVMAFLAEGEIEKDLFHVRPSIIQRESICFQKCMPRDKINAFIGWKKLKEIAFQCTVLRTLESKKLALSPFFYFHIFIACVIYFYVLKNKKILKQIVLKFNLNYNDINIFFFMLLIYLFILNMPFMFNFQ